MVRLCQKHMIKHNGDENIFWYYYVVRDSGDLCFYLQGQLRQRLLVVMLSGKSFLLYVFSKWTQHIFQKNLRVHSIWLFAFIIKLLLLASFISMFACVHLTQVSIIMWTCSDLPSHSLLIRNIDWKHLAHKQFPAAILAQSVVTAQNYRHPSFADHCPI